VWGISSSWRSASATAGPGRDAGDPEPHEAPRRGRNPALQDGSKEALAFWQPRLWDANTVWRRGNFLWTEGPDATQPDRAVLDRWTAACRAVAEARAGLERFRDGKLDLVMTAGDAGRRGAAGAAGLVGSLRSAAAAITAAAAARRELLGERRAVEGGEGGAEELAARIWAALRAAEPERRLMAAGVGLSEGDVSELVRPGWQAPATSEARALAELRQALLEAELAAEDAVAEAKAKLAEAGSISVRAFSVVWDVGERVLQRGEHGEAEEERKAGMAAQEALLGGADPPGWAAEAVGKAATSGALKEWHRAVRAAARHDPGRGFDLVFAAPRLAPVGATLPWPMADAGGCAARLAAWLCGRPCAGRASARLTGAREDPGDAELTVVASAPVLASWPWQRSLRAVSGVHERTCPVPEAAGPEQAQGDDGAPDGGPALPDTPQALRAGRAAAKVLEATAATPPAGAPTCLGCAARLLSPVARAAVGCLGGCSRPAPALAKDLKLPELARRLAAQDPSTLAPRAPGTVPLVTGASTAGRRFRGRRAAEEDSDELARLGVDGITASYLLGGTFRRYATRRLASSAVLPAVVVALGWAAVSAVLRMLSPIWPGPAASLTPASGLILSLVSADWRRPAPAAASWLTWAVALALVATACSAAETAAAPMLRSAAWAESKPRRKGPGALRSWVLEPALRAGLVALQGAALAAVLPASAINQAWSGWLWQPVLMAAASAVVGRALVSVAADSVGGGAGLRRAVAWSGVALGVLLVVAAPWAACRVALGLGRGCSSRLSLRAAAVAVGLTLGCVAEARVAVQEAAGPAPAAIRLRGLAWLCCSGWAQPGAGTEALEIRAADRAALARSELSAMEHPLAGWPLPWPLAPALRAVTGQGAAAARRAWALLIVGGPAAAALGARGSLPVVTVMVGLLAVTAWRAGLLLGALPAGWKTGAVPWAVLVVTGWALTSQAVGAV